jgi:tetratricopeptide (TPR) repeat protein
MYNLFLFMVKCEINNKKDQGVFMKGKIFTLLILSALSFTLLGNTENLKMGINSMNEKNYEESEKYLLKALNEDGNKNAYFYLGLLYNDEGKYDLAEEYYKKAIDAGSKNAINNLAMIYMDQEKYDLAEECYKMAVVKNVKGSVYNLGNLYYIQDKYELAKKYYRIAAREGDAEAVEMLRVIELDLKQVYY